MGPRRHAGEASDRILVFVDQFEETFTLCPDEAERDRVRGPLIELVDHAGTVVVIAIRADHLGRCAGYPALAERLTTNDVLVGPMRDTELRRVVELPAQRAGLEVEPGLVERHRRRRGRPSRRPSPVVHRLGRDLGTPANSARSPWPATGPPAG